MYSWSGETSVLPPSSLMEDGHKHLKVADLEQECVEVGLQSILLGHSQNLTLLLVVELFHLRV
jgi:hypothetical protein